MTVSYPGPYASLTCSFIHHSRSSNYTTYNLQSTYTAEIFFKSNGNNGCFMELTVYRKFHNKEKS